ncbi:hypothetical protein [Spirosoma montaniterrae]|uniref:Beta-galactosidase trimerisation domain-containing protein n=1 Tax=Spirosoma montaniterrae TaxID=1178516 RepID=A0A1P9X020_9BACT|nr:hypothetical protein [Spirosoma montaniterrae]AQG80935.1 hypothetical protein AWR27_17365 [Spirosoma montaniterrae]
MKRHLLLLFFATTALAQSPKQPLRRADSFFGLHFDFHADMADTLIGKTLTEGMVDSLLRLVKPDFIQVDSKGHPGVTSYPTKVGYKPKRFEKNTLKLFRDVTARHGVALYVHHSGVWDNEAVRHHPNWARIKPDGPADTEKTSLWSGYADSLLIPQLKEISDYGVDGVWVDGDCWAVEPDYGPAPVAAFRQATGLPDAPKQRTDPGYFAFMEQHRTAFKQYVKRYTDALHQHNPRFQVASNWSFTSFMPEPVSLPVDFISGDTDPLDGANRSAFQARCIAPQGKPWDLMSWSFGYGWSDRVGAPKPAIQLCQEAAQVLAMGGGFQAYWTQNNDASLTPWAFETMAELARFCRARQSFCHKAVPVPQVALLYSGVAHRAKTTGVYKFNADLSGNLIGTLNALLYNQLPTEILMEHHLHGRMAQYPLIVIPEWATLADTFRTELVQYVRDGGNLLVVGHQGVKLFENELGVTLQETTRPAAYFGIDNQLTGTKATYQPFEPLPGTRTLGGVYKQRDLRFGAGPLASVARLGKGQIAGVYLNVGEDFYKRETHVGRSVIGQMARALFQPQVSVSGSSFVHVALNRKDGQTMLNLINMAGNHANRAVYSTDEIPTPGPLTLTYRTAQKPKRLTLQPENRPVSFAYKNGEVSFTVPTLAIHSVVVIE